MHPRDAEIIARARRQLGVHHEFEDAVRALNSAVTHVIPAGRIYLLGTAEGPILGSLISGVGITPARGGSLLVRVTDEGIDILGPLGARRSLVATQ
ncbi:MAG: hypothetical protein AAGE52_41285 [Myxococcota bacterium]